MPKKLINSDSDIKALIECKKIFLVAPKKEKIIQSSYQQTFNVRSFDRELEFLVFIRHSSLLPEDFSIGLVYESFNLLRCNGYHGTTKAGFYSSEHHAYPHAHLLTYSDILSGRSKKPSKLINMTGKYLNLETALLYFFEYCNIIGYDEYFDINQLSFA